MLNREESVSPMDRQELAFGPFRLDRRNRSLSRDGAPVAIGGRALELLAVLASAAGDTVGKATLLDQVWPGLAVEENNLQVHISALRKALGEGWIVTVPGRGYRLTSPPVAEGPEASARLRLPAVPERPSIAVLAFANMSRDAEQEYFSDGIADDITTELSRNRSLFVVARNTSFTYKDRAVDLKQVARDLGVRYILEGSVRRSSDRVRVNAQLIEAESIGEIWAERYDRGVAEVFAVQDEIAAAVTAAIVPAVMDAEQRRALRKPPDSLGAWEAYHCGLWHISRPSAGNLSQAQAYFERSARLDETFAAPRYRLGHLFLQTATHGIISPQMAIALADPAVRRAIELDPFDEEALAVTAIVAAWQREWDRALATAEYAVSLNHNSVSAHRALGFCLMNFGRAGDARRQFQTCLRLNPRDPMNWLIRLQMGAACYLDRDYEAAAGWLEQASRDSPADPEVHICLAAARGQLGRADAAALALRRLRELLGTDEDGEVPFIVPRRRAEDAEHMREGLRKAGWLDAHAMQNRPTAR